MPESISIRLAELKARKSARQAGGGIMATIPLWMIAAAAGILALIVIFLIKSIHPRSSSKTRDGKNHSVTRDVGSLSEFPLLPGDKIGKYTIKKKLYDGMMTITYLAQDEKSSFFVKIPHPRYFNDKEYLERFFREAETLGRLSHPSIVRLFETGTHQEKGKEIPYMILEFIEGEDLGEKIRKESPLELEKALAIIKGIAKALEVVHSEGVIHRNIKPTSIRITRATPAGDIGDAKLLNFGISKATGVETITKVKTAIGTALYMAPEEISDEKPGPDHRVDLYSLGVMFYKLITGEEPHEEASIPRLLAAKLEKEPANPCTIKPSIPEPVADIVMKLLKRNPDERFQSATALIEALENIQLKSSGPAPQS